MHDGVSTSPPADRSEPCERLIVTLRGRTHELVPQPGETVVQVAFRNDVFPPISCLEGVCATCVGKVMRGSVAMIANEALTPDEVAQGYVLTCQSVPTAREVAVSYED